MELFSLDEVSLYKKGMKNKTEEIAKNNDIILLIIPYIITPENMQNYIVKEFEAKTGVNLPKLPKFNHQYRFVQSTTLFNFFFLS